MAIEVRELVIKATIVQDNASPGTQPSTSTQSGNASSSPERIVNLCVEKVMEILKTKNQR
jgi:hypothetical protein